jgi:hypothetical protein
VTVLTAEMLKELRQHAEAVDRAHHVLGPGWTLAHGAEMRITPRAMLALLDRIEALETTLGRLHGLKDAAALNQAIWKLLHPGEAVNSPSRLSEPDPDE